MRGFLVVLVALSVFGVGNLIARTFRQSPPHVHRAIECSSQSREFCESQGCLWDGRFSACVVQLSTTPLEINESGAQCVRPGRRPCHSQAVCDRTTLNGCRCPSGFVGDGLFCARITSTINEQSQQAVQTQNSNQKIQEEEPVCLRNPEYLKLAVVSGASPVRLASTSTRFEDLLTLARRQADLGSGDSVILTVSSLAYRGALMNWLYSVAAIGAQNYLIVATDEPMHSFLKKRHIPHYFRQGAADVIAQEFNLTQVGTMRVWWCYLLWHIAHSFGLVLQHGRLAKIWAYRYVILRAVLATGITVIQSDVDALFLRNPLSRLSSLDGDILAQRGHFPFNMVNPVMLTITFPCAVSSFEVAGRQKRGEPLSFSGSSCTGRHQLQSLGLTLAFLGF